MHGTTLPTNLLKHPMKTILKRILAMISLTLVVALSGLATIVLFPQPLFAYTVEHGKITVYANEEINPAIIPRIDNAMKLVNESELHDPDYTYDLFLSYNTLFNRIDDKVFGFGPSARATANNIVMKVRIDATRDLFFPTFHQSCEGSLTVLLAHEMIHCLQAHRYGITTFNPVKHPPMWKLEGYPEYIARRAKRVDKDYSLPNEIDRYTELERSTKDIWLQIEEGGCHAPKYYYKGRLMMEYLMDVKNMSYHEVLVSTRSEEEVYGEMMAWRKHK